MKIKKPIAPLCRLIREGTVGDCPKCGSTTQRKHEWGILGRWGEKIGCIHKECENYYKKKIRNN